MAEVLEKVIEIMEKMSYEIVLSKSAQKDLDKINDELYDRISDKINSMENNPRLIGSLN